MAFIWTYRKIKAHRARLAAEASAAEVSTAGKSPSSSPLPASKKCLECVQDKSRARKYRWRLLLGLTPAFFVASLDLTIIATALPEIASHFDRFNQLNWIVTAFTLTSTAFIPVFGQLADSFGRHGSLQTAVCILTIGSILCAATPDWSLLLFGRALQGVGTAGISNIVLIILADSVSLKEQAVNTSLFQLLNGIGYSECLTSSPSHSLQPKFSFHTFLPGVGPVIGGYLTNSNWRYCFVLCAGVSTISIVCIFLLRKDLKAGTVSVSHPPPGTSHLQALALGLSTLDYGGIALFILGVGLLILGTAWGGSTYSWNSPAVLSSLIIGSCLFILFLIYEALLSNPQSFLPRLLPSNTKPMIPSSILRSKDVSLVSIIAFSTGAAIYSVFYFIGIYFTLVEGYKASHAGTQLLYYVPGIGVGVYLAIFICNVYPRQTLPPLLLGTVVETAGLSALAYAVKSRNATLVNVMMGVAGAGTGMRFMPSSLHLAGMFRDRLAPVFSVLRFAMPFGGTLALTIMGSVFQNQMRQYFGSGAVISVPDNSTSNNNATVNLHNAASLDLISQLPPAEQHAIRAQGATATMWAFISIIPILGASLLASLFLGNVWISKSKKSTTPGTIGTEIEKGRSGDGTKSVDESGICKKHVAIRGGGVATRAAMEEEQRDEVEFLREVYLLAAVRGDVRRLKRKGNSEMERNSTGERAEVVKT